jgi:hypothetical protein
MRRLLLLALLLCGTVYAYADAEEFRLLFYNGGDWTNGYPYYIAPVTGPNGVFYAVMCDDYEHGGQPGDTWDANITNLGSQNIQLARFNNLSGPNALYALGLYDQAGWILLQTPFQDPDEWKAMNYAVWHIFDPNAPLYGDAQNWLDAAYDQWKIGFPGTDFGKVYIITPTNQHDPDPNGMQEFLYIGSDPSQSSSNTPGATTPEPGTILLVGTGALAMFRKKFLS